MPWALIAACVLATLTVTAGGSTRAPFLLTMAGDLGVGVSAVASLFGATSVGWGIASFVAGAGSDRWGRRGFLVGGTGALALAMAGIALSESFAGVIVWAALGGVCSGIFTGVSLAEISLRVDQRRLAQALGWVMSGQSLTLLLGVPLAAWVGDGIGWRGVHLGVGALAIVSAIALFATTMPAPLAGTARVPSSPPPLRQILSPPVIRLLVSVVAERVCFGLVSVFYATFLQTAHGLSIKEVALPLAIYAIGNILGTLAGGRLGDVFANRRLTFALSLVISGAVALALFGLTVTLPLTIALGAAYAFANAVSRPPLMAAMAEAPPDVRGTVMGLNSTSASLGWLLAATVGGWTLAGIGFAGFGPLIAVLTLLAALTALIGRA